MSDDEMERAAFTAALNSVRALWEGPAANLNTRSTLGSLSDPELGWIVHMAISEWIVTRSKQICSMRGQEQLIHSFSGDPAPWEKGAVLAALPVLGDLVGELGISEKPIGTWTRDEICQFVWSSYRAIDAVRINRDEAPGEFTVDVEAAAMLEAG